MRVDNTDLEGVFLITPKIHEDQRVIFRKHNKGKFEKIAKLKFDVVQDNQSRSRKVH